MPLRMRPAGSTARKSYIVNRKSLGHRSALGGADWIEPWTNPKRLVKAVAEMARAGIAHFQGHLGHVQFAGAEQFGGFFHPQPSQVLRDGLAGLAGKSAAQVKRAATDFLAQFFQ